MKKGFTLIEILAVVLIIGVLSAIAMPQYRKSIERTRVAEAKQMLPSIYDALQRYNVEAESAAPIPSFAKLDINLKGKATSSSNKWSTANFDYVMTPRQFALRILGTTNAPVYATVKTGKYQGTQIFYDGEEFSCNKTNSKTQTPNPCQEYQITESQTLSNLGNLIVRERLDSAASWSAYTSRLESEPAIARGELSALGN